jgi:nucleoside-diphosphate-sugar epimerase
MTTVVTGPKTRLGQALIAQAVARGETVVAVARDERDAAALADSGAKVLVSSSGAALDVVPTKIYVCALGPVHTTDPVDQAATSAAVDRDLAVIEKLLVAASNPRVVLVSTVIAVAPGGDRRYYGGWKCLVEQELLDRVLAHGGQLSVVYPGRLMADADMRRPWHRLHTRYFRLAQIVEKAGASSPTSRVVGLDARMWLMKRTLAVFFSSVTGSAGAAEGTKEISA